MHHLGWLEACVIGLMQGVSELFPISSVGHSVLVPALIGGSWARDLNVAAPESPYLAFIVGLHVATAIGLIVYFWRDWLRIITGLLTSLRDRTVETPDQRLAWLLILATIPVGVVGLVFEHTFRVDFARPRPASVFLFVNGLLLLGGERLRRRQLATAEAARAAAVDPIGQPSVVAARAGAGPGDRGAAPAATPARASVGPLGEHRPDDRDHAATDRRLSGLSVPVSVLIGATQIGALFAGLSRSGVVMVAGLTKGLSNEDAARFSFLLATPVIFAAGALKVPDLAGQLGNGIRAEVVVGSVLSGLGAYVSVRFLDRYFQTRTLIPFAVYCLVVGAVCAVRFGIF